jgi:hypothetical protein
VKATDLAAIISGVGGVVVAAIAIIVSARSTKNSVEAQERTTKAALSAQRDIAADERLWQRRADVYIQLLEWAGVIYRQGTLNQMDLSAQTAASDSVISGARLFASPAVLDQLEDISRLYSEYMGLLKDGEDGSRMSVVFHGLINAIHQLMVLVRAEILEHGRPVDAGPTGID